MTGLAEAGLVALASKGWGNSPVTLGWPTLWLKRDLARFPGRARQRRNQTRSHPGALGFPPGGPGPYALRVSSGRRGAAFLWSKGGARESFGRGHFNSGTSGVLYRARGKQTRTTFGNESVSAARGTLSKSVLGSKLLFAQVVGQTTPRRETLFEGGLANARLP